MKKHAAHSVSIGIILAFAGMLCCVTPAFAGKLDSAKVALDSVPVFFKDDFSGFRALDTSITELQRYNSLFTTGNFYSVNGHITSAARNLKYNAPTNEALQFGNINYDGIYLNNNAVEFMHTYYPVTTVKAVIGSKKEQVVELLHSQQIVPACNVGFRINGMRTAGYYNKQEANTIGFQAFASYKGQNGRYRSFFSYTYNRITAQLNGGLSSDISGSFAYPNLNDKALIPVNLTMAKHMLFGSDVYTKQIIGFGPKSGGKELGNYQKDSSTYLYKIALYARYSEYFRNYEGANEQNDYYSDFFISNDLFKDKLRAQKTSAHLSIYNTLGGFASKNTLGYEVQAGIENLDITMNAYKRNYFSTFTKVALAKNIASVKLKAEARYYINGYNAGNYQSLFTAEQALSKNSKWSFNLGSNSLNPQAVYNHYSSNNFYWDTTFNAIKQMFANATFQSKKYGKAMLQYNIINNYLYFDNTAHSAQYNSSIALTQFTYSTILKWKALRVAPEILVQIENSKQQILGLPKLFAKTMLYFETRIFKRNLWLQAGTDIFWLGSYKPYAYMAATNQYFYQTQFTTGTMPLVDVFVNFKIKTVQVFVRAEQLSTILAEPYFFTPYYAMPGFTFKVGLNWLFIN